MAEHIVEAVGLLQVIELLGLAHPPARGKAAVGQVLEEHGIRHQAGHRHHLPAGGAHQGFIELVEAGHAVALHAQRGQALQEFIADAAAQHRGLAVVELGPHRVVRVRIAVQRLRDGEIGAQLLAGQQAGVELFLELVGQGAGKAGLGVPSLGGDSHCVHDVLSPADLPHSLARR